MFKKRNLLLTFILSISAIIHGCDSNNNGESPTNEQQEGINQSELETVVTKDKEGNDDHVKIMKRIENMSIDEKIGQMIFAGVSGPKPDEEMHYLINDYKVGGIIFNKKNLISPQQTVNYLNHIKTENAKNQLPILLGIDQEGGRVSKLPGELVKYPTNAKVGEINDSTFSYELGTHLGKALNTYGFNVNFAPVLDVHSNPSNPVIGDRSLGSNPALVSELGIQTMKGLQVQNIISVVKHFPGHGDTSVDSHLELPIVNKTMTELENLELIPFKQAIGEGADIVMIAHILLPKIDPEFPSSMSGKVITDLLRKQLGFNGVVLTDDMTMSAITNQYDIGQATVKSIKAGTDIVMIAHDYNKIVSSIKAVKLAIENGELTEERIDASVKRIIHLKEKYNIKDTEVENVQLDDLNNSIKLLLKNYIH